MRIPIRIDPDNLKDTIIEIRYLPGLHSELIPGLLVGKLDGYKFASTRQSSSNPPHVVLSGNYGFFVHDIITVQINEGSLVFNTKDQYPGWKIYFGLIKKFVTEFVEFVVYESQKSSHGLVLDI